MDKITREMKDPAAERYLINKEKKAEKDLQIRSITIRKERIMDRVREQYKNYLAVKEIILKAKELLKVYGNSKNIPEEELDIDKSGFDDARLLAFCEIIEEEKKQSKAVH